MRKTAQRSMNGEVFDAIGKGIAVDILYGFRNGGLGDVLQHLSMRKDTAKAQS